MRILIDNGHGVDTAGKRSPDGRLLEYKWNREVASMLLGALKSKGIDAELIVTEQNDISLKERCARVNKVCRELGSQNVAVVSVHVNAAGNGGWNKGRGFSVYVYTEASQKSRFLAQYMYDAADNRGLRGNRAVPPTRYWTANFYILKNTNCPAVLTENLFQDNKDDVDFLLSEKGKQTIVDLHVEAIQKYIGLHS